MSNHFTNMDSLWLQMLRGMVNTGEVMVAGNEKANEIMTRLDAIAGNLQRMDEANQILSNNRTYEQGYAAAEAAMRRRSNILPNPEGEDEHGKSILEQINKRVAEGNLKKIALGERALEDKPHEFNARVRTAKPKAKPTIDLDLSFLGDL